MSTVKIHYDGWIALPEDIRQKLGLHTSDALTVELLDGVIHLRPGRTAPMAVRQEQPQPEASAQITAPALAPEKPPVRRGRPPKANPAAPATRLPLIQKARGRKAAQDATNDMAATGD